MPRIPIIAASVAAATCLTLAIPAHADSPFAGLDGAWNGSGSVKLENGKTEKLKCKGYYNLKGADALNMAINCGNASFKINMRAQLADAGGKISGSWEEREFNQVGTISGNATATNLKLTFSGAISGSMNVTLSGNSQTVSISTGGPGFTGVNLEFAKSS